MKILTVLTGGTIGSKKSDNIINVASSSCYIVEKYKAIYKNDIDFTIKEPLNILSENVTSAEWERLVNFLLEINTADFDGIIITHGSDTLAYTSVLLSYAFEKTDIPIVLVAADKPLEDEASNGLVNFNGAVEFIKNHINGVFVSYKNRNDENAVIYSARQIVSSSPFDDCFSSFNRKKIADITDNGLVFYGIEESDYSFDFSLKPFSLKNKVAIIEAYPNIDYSLFSLENKQIKAVVHYLYHSATGCTQGENTSLKNFVSKCNSLGIKSYLASFKSENQTYYQTTKELVEAGGIPLYNMSKENAYIWALLKVNLG